MTLKFVIGKDPCMGMLTPSPEDLVLKIVDIAQKPRTIMNAILL
jgi:hypothetical protein